ncbi:hypothetical protein [Agromyces sp. ZXT2-3]|uniref:hypothetical protein n=1 Tax=Agromyces sp. ZXT2-3 TaxID=3461152 RepID=UPI004055231B
MAAVAAAPHSTDATPSDTDLAGIILPGSGTDPVDTVEIIAELIRAGKSTHDSSADGHTPDPKTISAAEPARPVAPPRDVCNPENPTVCAFEGAEPEPVAPGEPTVTLRDIASFRPSVPSGQMQPDGWAVVDLPANFIGAASVETRSGTLLGRPAEVRFHPVAYQWRHSDGTLVHAADPGATWEQLGLAEFTPTLTSHTYAASGRYTVEPTVVYVAEYRFDGSAWRWIDGTLSLPAPQLSVLVGEFDTVLVTGDCAAVPDGPGC